MRQLTADVSEHDERVQARCGSAAFGLLRFRGADARKFLQGQLSNDMDAARRRAPHARRATTIRRAGCWRCCACWRPTPSEIIALLPAELAEPTLTALRRYVLRAKVTISA